jgi:hypothetical protein
VQLRVFLKKAGTKVKQNVFVQALPQLFFEAVKCTAYPGCENPLLPCPNKKSDAHLHRFSFVVA